MNPQEKLVSAAVAAVLGFCAAPGQAFASEAEDPELQTITITATRIPTPVSEVPVTVSVISAERMENQMVESIENLVRYEPGVTVRVSPARFTAAGSSTGRDGQSGFNIRGLEGNRVLIQIDGVRTPDAYAFGAQSVGRGEYVDLGMLKSVEILRGPTSALYGSDGLAGAVSYITKDPSDLLTGGRNATASVRGAWADVDQTMTWSGMAAGRAGGWEGMVVYTRRDGEGQETQGSNDSANTDRTIPNPEDNYSNGGMVKLVRNLTENQRLRLSWDHMDSEVNWNVLSAIAKPPLTSTSTLGLAAFDKMKRDRLALDHLYTPSPGWLDSLATTIYGQESHTRQYSDENRNTAADRTRDAHFDNRVIGGTLEAHSTWQGASTTHDLAYGADFSETRQQGLRDGTVPPAGETFPTRAFPTTDYTLAGVYVQDTITWKSLTLYPALRWDSYRIDPQQDPLFIANVPEGQTDSRLSPKLGALLRLGEQWSVFANLATGFKAPAPSQVNTGFTNPAAFYQSISNPELKPETSESIEAGVRWNTQRASLDFTGFAGRYEDFIEQVLVRGTFTQTDPAIYQYVNLDEARIHGFEARATLQLATSLRMNFAGAWAFGTSERDGVSVPLASVNPLQLVAGLNWQPLGRRFGAEFAATYGGRKDEDRLGVTCTGGCFVPGDYLVMDAFGWWNIAGGATVRAGVFNLADVKYWQWSDVRGLSNTSVVKDAYSQPGRNLSVSFTFQL